MVIQLEPDELGEMLIRTQLRNQAAASIGTVRKSSFILAQLMGITFSLVGANVITSYLEAYLPQKKPLSITQTIAQIIVYRMKFVKIILATIADYVGDHATTEQLIHDAIQSSMNSKYRRQRQFSGKPVNTILIVLRAGVV